MSRTTGKKFGFVRFVSPLYAQKAIKVVNGRWIQGETLVANISRFGIKNKLKCMQSNNYNQNGIPKVYGQGLSSGNGRGLNRLRVWRLKNVNDLPSKSLVQDRPINRAQIWRKKEFQVTQQK